jgi:nucleoside-diphosphate-sugar epimerase
VPPECSTRSETADGTVWKKVARHLTSKLVASSYTVHSVIRKESQVSDLEALGAKPVLQSVEESNVDQITATIKKCNPNVVIWSAGAGAGGAERTKAVDHMGKSKVIVDSNKAFCILISRLGAVKVFDAIAAAGVKRFIIVSAVDIRDRENKPVPEWQVGFLLFHQSSIYVY